MLRPFLAVCMLTLLASLTAASNAFAQISGEQVELTEVLASDASVFEKAKACQRLAVVGDASSVGAIAPLLHDLQLSVYARTALEQIPGQAAEDALMEAFQRLRRPAADRGGIDEDQRERLLIGMIHSIGRRSITSAQTLIGSLAEDTDASEAVRRIAARTLAEWKDVTDATPAVQRESNLASLLASDDAGRFRQGLQLARQRGGDASGVIIKQLPNLEPPRQTAVLIWLADLGDSSLVGEIEPLTQSTDDDVAASAWEAIAALGGLSVSDAADRSGAAFEAAVERPAIASRVLVAVANADQSKMNDRVRRGIVDLADGRRAFDSAVAIGLFDYAVTARLEPATEPLLQIARSHDDPAVVAAALRAAGSLATAAHLSQLMVVADAVSQRFPDDALAAAADEAIQRASVRMPPDQVAEVIGDLLSTAKGTRKEKLMEQLAYAGGERALSIVADAARGDDPADVDLATRVLGQWLSTDAADVLGDLASELANPTYKLRSLRGYLRIGRQFDMQPEDRTDLATRAYALAIRAEERKMALEILTRYPTLQGLQWLVEKSDDEARIDDQERRTIRQSLVQLAQRVAQDQPQQAGEVIRRLDLETFPPPMRAELQGLVKPSPER